MGEDLEPFAQAMMRQYAPYPQILHDLIYKPKMRITVHPSWCFELTDRIRDPAGTHSGEAGGLTFTVTAYTLDAYHDFTRGVDHLFPVPAATYDRQSWQLWIKDCLLAIHDHEINEGLIFGDERPFAPNHGPGRNPYKTFVYAEDAHRRMSFKGELKPA